MKLSLPAFLIPVIMGTAMAAETVFIRQIQIVNGVNMVTDIPLSSDSGSAVSGLLDGDMGVFQLYTTYTNIEGNSVLAKLDEKSAGFFLTQVTIQTYSEDPHVPTCTRADQPYSVAITVSGMMEGSSVPDYAKTVLLGTGYQVYSPTTYEPLGLAGDYADAWTYESNGTYASSNIIQRIPGGSPTLAMGTETYSAFIRPEAESTLGQLATAEVTIWPVAIGGIEGIEENKTYFGLPQDVTMVLRYAYPRSTSYAQIYKGPPSLGSAGSVISGSVKKYNTNLPQDATIQLGSLDEYYSGDDQYTIEVLTVTPFNGGNPERLAYVTFFMKRSISLNAMVSTME